VTDKPAPKFEDFLKQVEEAVRSLESGNLGLEESIGRYESGMTALKRCYEILEQAEKKIEQLVRQKDGSLGTRPIEVTAASEPARKRKIEGDAPAI
jgi:exodeoxyribonuclease VII small subunit